MRYPIKKMLIRSIQSMVEKTYHPMQVPSDLNMIENISYIEDGLVEHKLDIIYPPKRQEKYPIIINIHGGAFCMNSKEMLYRDYAIKLSRNQFAVVNINYTLSTKEVFPKQIEDVLEVLKFISNKANMYQLDLENIFIVGDSAGAYLAAMVGCIITSPKLQMYYNWKLPIKIRAIASNCGMFDFDTYMQKDVQFPMRKGITEILFGTKEYQKLESYGYSSVLKYINKDFPPIYIMDTGLYSFEMEARRLEKVLIENHIEHQIHIYDKYEKLPHAFNIMEKYAQGEEALEELFRFFERHLTDKGDL
ncbi:MAG: alpha/beta hydrolase [Cellulosilyticum sp.]|nr:alpha/beta hydrolase [Cellulosilyticum sp.]